MPHVEARYQRYRRDRFVIVGAHTPEFAFEHVESNVAAAVRQLHAGFLIAIVNNHTTWNAYRKSYWPAEYLIDRDGNVRHLATGEGDYGQTEALIRELLIEADPLVQLPARTDVPDLTPKTPSRQRRTSAWTTSAT
ncbi:MAG TPA: hypothetical protein VED84_00525 [Acidimicrobiales bacterium]|nr:hypothetical protein [Acidimicrobiales bacterium]